MGKAIQMIAGQDTPTKKMVHAIETAYAHFNKRLFESKLPPLFLNLSRAGRNVMGFFAPDAWEAGKDKAGNDQHVCELSLTPEGTRRSAEEVFSTLVHEMVHYLDHVEGRKPKSPGYHAKPWFEFMDKIGLPPMPDGNSRIRVSHNIAKGGPFAKAFADLPASCRLPFVSRFADTSSGKSGKKDNKQGKRARYECDECCTIMRGPSGRKLVCGDCGCAYTETGF